MQPEANSDNHPKWTSLLTEQHQNPCLLKHLKQSTQCIGKLSGPKLMGNNCSNVRTVDLPSLSYIKTGIEGYKSKSQHESITIPPSYLLPQHISKLTSQNSLIYCLHIPHGDAGGEISVATANARTSPLLAPSTTAVPRAVRSAQVPTG